MQYALITGGASGMGRATALKLAENGYHVFSCDIKKNADERLGFISNLTDKDKTTSISLADHIFVQMCKDLICENKIEINKLNLKFV